MTEKIKRARRHPGPQLVGIDLGSIAEVAKLFAQLGPAGTVAELGLSRAAILSILATGRASHGTAALLREALRARGVVA